MVSKQGTQSALISVAVNTAQTAIFFFCTFLMVGPALTAMRWILGMGSCVVTFVLHRDMVFAQATEKSRKEAMRYGVTSILSVTLATWLYAWMALVWPGADPTFLQVVSMIVVWPLVTWPLMKRWVFPNVMGKAQAKRVRALRP